MTYFLFPPRATVGIHWQADETDVKVAGQWRSVYRAVDEFGQLVDVFVARRRDAAAARRFFDRAITTTRIRPLEVVTGRAATYPIVLEELLPGCVASHRAVCQQPHRGGSRPVEGAVAADARAQAGPQRRVIIAGHALVQNVRRGHYELAVEAPAIRRVAVAFGELAVAI